MVIIGIGTDLCEIARIAKAIHRFEDRFKSRIFTQNELHAAKVRSQSYVAKNNCKFNHQINYAEAAFLAKRFSAKEAFSKAIDINNLWRPISWKDIEIVNSPSGKPEIILYRQALERLKAFCKNGEKVNVHLSLTDTNEYAQSVVIIEAY